MKRLFLLFFVFSLLQENIFSDESVSFRGINTNEKTFGIVFIEVRSYTNFELRKSIFDALSSSRTTPEIFKKDENDSIYYYSEISCIYNDESITDIAIMRLKQFDTRKNIGKNVPENLLQGLGLSADDVNYFSDDLEEFDQGFGKQLTGGGTDTKGEYEFLKMFYIGDAEYITETFKIFYARSVSLIINYIDANKIERFLYYYLMDLQR